MSPHVSSAWTAAGWTMLHLVWIGAAGGLAVALLRRLLHRTRPEVRHGVAVACLLALAAAPVLLFAWLYRPEPAAGSAPARSLQVASPAEWATGDTARPPSFERHRPGVKRPTVATSAPAASRFEPLVGYLPGVWLSGSMLTLSLLATGLVGVEQLRRSCLPLEACAIAQRCQVLASSLGVAQRVGVAICDRLAAPVLIGVVRPMILLPPAALSGWTIEEVEMALLHELAHLRRRDNVVTLLQRLVEALLFFHPATWWLSAWVSLERELCCDRLVVERTGKPQAYARMLAALAGASPGAWTPALAMAQRPLTTRIRRILDMEDRSMKLTLTEGLGLLVAAIVGTTLTLATYAEPPHAVPADTARQTLGRLAESVVAQPTGRVFFDGKGEALVTIAQSQIKLGDRTAALTTLRLLEGLAEPKPTKAGTKVDDRAWQRIAVMTESAALRRAAGDVVGARATLDRAVRYFDEVFHDDTLRVAIDQVEIDQNEAAAATFKGDESDRMLSESVVEAASVCAASMGLIEQYVALGDMLMARKLIRRVYEAIGPIHPIQGPTKLWMVGALGGGLVKAGDGEGGHKLIEQARQVILDIPDPNIREAELPRLAHMLSEAGDLDKALGLVGEMKPRMQEAAFVRILEGFTTDLQRVAWFDPGGIKITIGEQSLTPKDSVSIRTVLPKIAVAVRGTGDARVQARTLAIIAHLQARAGDFHGAIVTAESIPDLKRSDYPGPSDGFYDAVKPAAYAIVAALQAAAGDRAVAVATFAKSEALARAIESEDQKLVAQIVIAQKQAESGGHAAAKAIVTEAVTLALTQPEPRRSRVLAMLAGVQVQANDNIGALRTIDAIRDSPGLEKAQALGALARRHKELGDVSTSETLMRRELACLESKPPESPLPGKVLTSNAFGRTTFVDFDLELDSANLRYWREMGLRSLRATSGDIEAAVRGAKALPPEQRDNALSQIVGDIADHGDVAGAMELATSIESPDARVHAFARLAIAIPKGPAKQ